MDKFCIGVDIGGTTVKLGLFTKEGDVIKKWEIPTRKEEKGSYILKDTVISVDAVLSEQNIKKEQVLGVGIGVPGPVTKDGTVLECVNLGWGIVQVADEFRSLSGIANIKVGNDANVAALGEMWKGGGKGHKNVVMVTLGTGVGGGVILNGEILTGSRGAAGEIGHIKVRFDEEDSCTCGGHGCLEQYASARGIVKEAKRKLQSTNEQTKLRNLSEITAKDIFDLAKEEDKVAIELVDQLGYYLGTACSHIAQVVDPEVFVIGGGVSKAGTILTDVIEQHYEQLVMKTLKNREFTLATLGNDAGIFGSARMVLE